MQIRWIPREDEAALLAGGVVVEGRRGFKWDKIKANFSYAFCQFPVEPFLAKFMGGRKR